MTNFTKKTFSVGVGGDAYRSGYERTFGPRRPCKATRERPCKGVLAVLRCTRDADHVGRHKAEDGATWS